MKKLMIAVVSEVLLQSLTEALSSDYRIVSCCDGESALDRLVTEKPQLLLLDLMLPGMDGITLLHAARRAGANPRVLAVSTYVSDYVVESLEQLKVSYIVRLPCRSQILAERLRDMDRISQGQSADDRGAQEWLAALGFRVNSVGCRMVLTAFELLRKDPHQKLTKQLYPAVAQICGGSAMQVEKAIRSAIESAWVCRNEGVWRAYFSVGQNGKVSRPTNADFLARMLLYARGEEIDPSFRKETAAI